MTKPNSKQTNARFSMASLRSEAEDVVVVMLSGAGEGEVGSWVIKVNQRASSADSASLEAKNLNGGTGWRERMMEGVRTLVEGLVGLEEGLLEREMLWLVALMELAEAAELENSQTLMQRHR